MNASVEVLGWADVASLVDEHTMWRWDTQERLLDPWIVDQARGSGSRRTFRPEVRRVLVALKALRQIGAPHDHGSAFPLRVRLCQTMAAAPDAGALLVYWLSGHPVVYAFADPVAACRFVFDRGLVGTVLCLDRLEELAGVGA